MRTFAASAILCLALSAAFAAAPPTAGAEWYKWVDEDGVLHVTDDPNRVPREKRGRVEEVSPDELPHVGEEGPPSARPVMEERAAPAPELYGGRTLEWWKESFAAMRRDLAELKKEIARKEDLVNVFEGGRRFGQIFTEEQVETYQNYKDSLSKDRESVEKIREEVESLRSRARRAGVPRSVRGGG